MKAKLWGLGAAFAFAAQVVLLAGHGPGALVIAATLAWATWQVWSYRGWLSRHVDMIVLMCAYGGLGMMPGAPQCHETARTWFGMAAGMLVLGLPPVFWGSRCFAAARFQGNAVIVLLFDTLGMTAGMGAMHLETAFISLSPLPKHFVMVFGMAAGMLVGSALSTAYFTYSRRKVSNIGYVSNNHSLSA
jgi:hypothetical protein